MLNNIFNTKTQNAKKELEEEIKKQKAKQKELEKKPIEENKDVFRKYSSTITKDTIVKIENYHFRVSQNIESISTTLNIGIKKIETIKHPIYQKIGGNEENISFSARILITDISEYEGFVNLIKKAKPLKLQILSEPSAKILIQTLTESKKNWIVIQDRGISYYSKEISISGVLL